MGKVTYYYFAYALLGASFCFAGEISSAENDALGRMQRLGRAQEPSLATGVFHEYRAVDPLEKAQMDDEIKQILIDQKDSENNNPVRLLRHIAEEMAHATRVQGQEELDYLMWQHTVQAQAGPFGFYNRDFVELGLFAADLVADRQLYKMLNQRRIELIFKRLLDDQAGMVSIIDRVNESHGRYEEREEQMSVFGRFFSNKVKTLDALLNPLRDYIKKEHSLVKGFVPLNKATIVPLFFRWCWEKVSTQIQEGLVVDTSWSSQFSTDNFYSDPVTAQERSIARKAAYVKNDAGDLEQMPLLETPYSVATGVKGAFMLLDPIQSIRKILFSNDCHTWLTRLQFVNRLSGIGIPDTVFSSATRLGLEVLGMALSVSYYDQLCTERWTTFVIENRETLKRKMLSYRRALTQSSATEEEVKQARTAIYEFVVQGHEGSATLPGNALMEWKRARGTGSGIVGKWLMISTLAICAFKIAQKWYSLQPDSSSVDV